jgi:hypothetical protein
MVDLNEYIESNTLRCEVSHRGGGIEVDASEYTGVEGHLVSAYQNYLGGGLLGSVQSSTNLKVTADKTGRKTLELQEALKQYYYNLTNPVVDELDEWSSTESFEAQQSRPASGY